MATLLASMLLATFLMTSHSHAAREHPLDTAMRSNKNPDVMQSWSKTLPGGTMPLSMQDLVSPLSTAQVHSYKTSIERGSMTTDPAAAAAFCSAADVLCRGLDDLPADGSAKIVSLQSRNQYNYGGGGDVPPAEVDELARSTWFLEKHLTTGRGADGTPYQVPASTFSDQLERATRRTFLPRALADSLTTRDVFQNLHIPAHSVMGDAMRQTSAFCLSGGGMRNGGNGGLGGMHSKPGACVTSLEDMADHVARSLAPAGGFRDGAEISMVQALGTTSFSSDDAEVMPGAFQVVKAELKADEKSMYTSCHSLMFPFQVAYCHSIPVTRVYSVTLKSTAKPDVILTNVVLCHMDTSEWSPSHVAFQVLGNKPGDSEACHWSNSDGFAFVFSAPPPPPSRHDKNI